MLPANLDKCFPLIEHREFSRINKKMETKLKIPKTNFNVEGVANFCSDLTQIGNASKWTKKQEAVTKAGPAALFDVYVETPEQTRKKNEQPRALGYKVK